MNERFNILLVYAVLNEFPMRNTSKQLLECFPKYLSRHRFFKVNAAFQPWPSFLRGVPFDGVLLMHHFVANRISPNFNRWVDRLEWIRDLKCPKAVFPQDEYIGRDQINHLIDRLGITHLFTLAPKSEWENIYGSGTLKRVQFFRVLPGYLDSKVVKKIEKLASKETCRPIDIGYRAKKDFPSLGRQGWLKSKISDAFLQATRNSSLHCNISNRHQDTFFGDHWYRFLLRCKYTIGIQGGGSILDPDGSLAKRVRAYLCKYPNETNEHIEKLFFPNRDGEINYVAISPRHLEACATRTCQILIKGSYNEILRPNIHYIPLEKDFSNLKEVIDIVKADKIRQKIVDRAYQDIIQNHSLYYDHFAEEVFSHLLNGKSFRGTAKKYSRNKAQAAIHQAAKVADFASWIMVILYSLLVSKPYYFLQPYFAKIFSPQKLLTLIDYIRYGKVIK